ncbi:MAG: M20/M25/M40 family metallo-hydrolase [Candidatus Bathyarchaeota archaeon]|nr:M20/M25/M40 family metallo-hydrolase [Candidatus Bathyarchaeota archaeon]
MPTRLFDEVKNEITTILSNLIRINTTNPPGNELEAANYLKNVLSSEGFDCEIIKSAPKRANIITRMKGTGKKPSLLLLSHLDVVAANEKQWSINPFGGLIKDGYVWGRGALDMKGMTTIEIMVYILLKRNDVQLKGDLILAATADEEKGGINGAKYLMENYREKISADYVINEGGGHGITIQNRTIFTIQNAEKGIIWFKVKTKGIPGHASMPDKNTNAIILMNKVIEKLTNYNPQTILPTSLRMFLEKLAINNPQLIKSFSDIIANPPQSDLILNKLAEHYPDLVTEIRPRVKTTITPTIIKGGLKENVLPSECETTFDCRILPGQSSERTLEIIKTLLKDIDSKNIEIEILQIQEPTVSKVDTKFYDTIVSVLKDFKPGCGVTPLLMTGGTDSRFFRRIGSICYGFQPRLLEKSSPRIITREHGIDERISIRNLVFGTSVLYEVVKQFLC